MKNIWSVVLAVVLALLAPVVAAEGFADDYKKVAEAATAAKSGKAVMYKDDKGQFYAVRYCREVKDDKCRQLNERPGLQIIRARMKAGANHSEKEVHYYDYFREGTKVVNGKMDHVYDSSGDSTFVTDADQKRQPTEADQETAEQTVRILARAIREGVAK